MELSQFAFPSKILPLRRPKVWESALFTSQAGHTVFTLLSLTLLDMEGQTGEETRPEGPNVANDWVKVVLMLIH